MSPDTEPQETDARARRLAGAIHEHSAFAVERLPGLAVALDRFVAELPRFLAPLLSRDSGPGAFEGVRATSLFQAIADCSGLTAAIFVTPESEARILIALDERIDELIVAAVFGQSALMGLGEDLAPEAPRPRTLIETALVEEFSRALGRALESSFASLAPLELAFERLVPLDDTFALGRRDLPAAATRFSLPMSDGVFEGLVLLPQSFLMRLRRELEADHMIENSGRGSAVVASPRNRSEADAAAGDRGSGGRADESWPSGELSGGRNSASAKRRLRRCEARMFRPRDLSLQARPRRGAIPLGDQKPDPKRTGADHAIIRTAQASIHR